MNQTARPIPGQRYRHFKGNLYQIITLGYHSETNEEMVVYQALYGEYKVYIRPLSMFMERVDKVKYPDIEQEYRFELVYSPDKAGVQEHSDIGADEIAAKSAENEEPQTPVWVETATEHTETDSDEAGDGVNPLLMQFLDAETYSAKLKIFLEMRDTIDEVILTDVAASLDISTGTGSLEEQYASVQYALHTLAKYERSNR